MLSIIFQPYPSMSFPVLFLTTINNIGSLLLPPTNSSADSVQQSGNGIRSKSVQQVESTYACNSTWIKTDLQKPTKEEQGVSYLKMRFIMNIKVEKTRHCSPVYVPTPEGAPVHCSSGGLPDKIPLFFGNAGEQRAPLVSLPGRGWKAWFNTRRRCAPCRTWPPPVPACSRPWSRPGRRYSRRRGPGCRCSPSPCPPPAPWYQTSASGS